MIIIKKLKYFLLYSNKERLPFPFRHAFTLVELLVVVAIIAILAALGMPLIKSTIEKGNSTKCVNNLRQIRVAIVQYTADNDGYLPYSYGPTPPGGGQDSFSGYNAPLPQLLNVGVNSKAFPTANDYNKATARHPFNCPSCKTTNRTYTANEGAMGATFASDRYPQRKINALSDVSKLVLIADDNSGDSPTSVGADFFNETDYLNKIGMRHNGKANILFADLHIETLSKTNLIKRFETNTTYTLQNVFKQ